ncbi:MAG: ABC-2 family transporter protein, partial [Chloroflexi bacterium]|nr:ABC-2 family transporter protein [Chloroflexota bacterium]
ISIFFQHRDTLGDWTYNQVLIVVGLFTFFHGVLEAFLRPNVGAVVEQVRDGTFDFVLTKPVNSQFIASLRTIVIWRMVDMLIGLGLIAYAARQMNLAPSLADIALFALMLALGSLMIYSIWLAMVSLAFWFVKIGNITELFYAFYEAGRYPVTIYRGVVQALLTFIVPIAFVTTFPASALLGKLNSDILIIGLALAFGLFVFSMRFWNFAIRHYSSASS